ncbi:MAG: hypothetical protein AAFU57_18570 [Bacteroidota bacterium]
MKFCIRPLLILSLIILLQSAIISCDSKAPPEPIQKEKVLFDYGVVEDSTYCNDFFKFRISFCEEFIALSQQDNVTPSEIGAKIPPYENLTENPGEDQNLLAIYPKIQEVTIDAVLHDEKVDFEDFQAAMQQKTRAEQFGPEFQLFISSHSLEKESLIQYINQFSNLHPPNYDFNKTHEATIGGESFLEYHGVETQESAPASVAFAIMGGKNRKIVSYFKEINGYAFCIDLFYHNEGQKAILLELLETMEFH